MTGDGQESSGTADEAERNGFADSVCDRSC